MKIGEYQQLLKCCGIDYVLNETNEGIQVIDHYLVIKTFDANGDLI